MAETKLHIAMFPWLAFGHILPFLQLAKLIASKGHKISFISTSKNIDRLPRNQTSMITFVKLDLPSVENLPATAHATSDLPIESVSYLKKAYDLLNPQLADFLRSSNPDWIVFDYVPFWLPPLARELNIGTVYFSIFLASVMAFVAPPAGEAEYRRKTEDYTVEPRWMKSSTVCYRRFEAEKNFPAIGGDEELQIPEFHRFTESLRGCDLIAVRSCREVEAEYLDLLEEIQGKPVYPIGVLPSEEKSESGSGSESEGSDWFRIRKWLDEQETGSVVYVAFGSEAKPSQEELTEIAMGLEVSGLKFFWVLRTQRSADDPEVLELPDGFEERTRRRGVVWKGWAPQVKILTHDSVGGFLTHSGWSSVVESLQFGRPLVLLTFYADQGLNSKLLQEKGVGYLVPRDELTGRFTREAVADSVRMVVVEEDGRRHREKAGEMKKLFGDLEKHRSYVDDFLRYLVDNKLN